MQANSRTRPAARSPQEDKPARRTIAAVQAALVARAAHAKAEATGRRLRDSAAKQHTAERRTRRSLPERLREAICALAPGHVRIASHRETAWASITFSGSRHRLQLLFEGPQEVAAGELLIAALPDHEFDIPGQIVADATIMQADHSLLPDPRLVVMVELLLLEDA